MHVYRKPFKYPVRSLYKIHLLESIYLVQIRPHTSEDNGVPQ